MRPALLFVPADWRFGVYWSRWARSLYLAAGPLQLRLDFERKATR